MKPAELQLRGGRLPDGYDVRRATEADAESIHLVESVGQQAPWTLAVIIKELRVEWSRTWVVIDDRGVCAYLCVWLVADEIHILNVVVHPRVRRQGLGRGLVEELIEQAERSSYSVVTLEVRVGNDGARQLYEATGFREIGRRQAYYSDNGEDALVMARILEESRT